MRLKKIANYNYIQLVWSRSGQVFLAGLLFYRIQLDTSHFDTLQLDTSELVPAKLDAPRLDTSQLNMTKPDMPLLI